MDENFQIYSEPVLEFITSAQSFCNLVHDPLSLKRSELVAKLQQILPLLYLNALKLPEVDAINNEGNEKFVTEEEYESIQNKLAKKLGYLDDYLEVESSGESDEGLVVTRLSEGLTDIYQDLQDFLRLYQLGTDEMMNDAIWECCMNFNHIWGKKLPGILRVLHEALNADEPIDEEEQDPSPPSSGRDTSEWFISRRQQEYRNK